MKILNGVPTKRAGVKGITGTRVAATLLWASLTAVALQAQATPQGGQVTAGRGSITNPNANLTVVNQKSNSLIVNWSSFNIGASQTVKFVQPGKNAAALNRIFDQNPTQIYGQLLANGQVFLVNPNGVFFSKTAYVNTGALFASSLDISDANFLSGNYQFSAPAGQDGGAVINHGTLVAADGGSVNLIGGSVYNDGLIQATLGQVDLVAGHAVTVDFDGDGLMSFEVTQPVLHQMVDGNGVAVTNAGTVEADGGTVVMTANVAQGVFAQAVNNSGIIEATGVVQHQGGGVYLAGGGIPTTMVDGTAEPVAPSDVDHAGSVTLTGQGGNVVSNGTIDVSAQQGDAGSVALQSTYYTLLTNGSIDASAANGVGGSVELLGHRVGLIGTTSVDASGALGGGTILVGGDTHGGNGLQVAEATFMGLDTTLDADATLNGDGGKVVLWSQDYTGFYGSISAQGGAQGGDGGFVETSSHDNLQSFGNVSAGAAKGELGTWLLDPENIEICATAGAFCTANSGITTAGATFTANANNSLLLVTNLNTALNGNGANVIVWTTSGTGSVGAQPGDIVIEAPIVSTETQNGRRATLTLDAAGSICMGGGASTCSSGSFVASTTDGISSAKGGLSINLFANYGGNTASTTYTAGACSGCTISITSPIVTSNAAATGAAVTVDLENGGATNTISLTSSGTITATGGGIAANVEINNSGAGGAVTLGTAISTNGGTFSVGNSGTPASGGASFDDTSGSIATGGGNLFVDVSGAVTVGGNINTGAGNVDIRGVSITETGTATIVQSAGATTNFAGGAGSIALNNNNTFGGATGAVSISNSGANNVSIITGGSAVNLSNVSVAAGNLTIQTTNANGAGAGAAITQDATGVVVGGSAIMVAGSTNNITLTTSAVNNINTFAVTSGNNVALTNNALVNLAASTVSGTYAITAAGNITATGALAVTGGNSTFTVTGAAHNVVLDGFANTFSNRTITLNATGGGSVGTFSLENDSTNATFPTLTATPTSLTLDFPKNNSNLNLPGGLSLTTLNVKEATTSGTGTIVQAGAVTVSGTTTLADPNNITLNTTGNDFGTVTINSGATVILDDTNSLTLNGVTATGTVTVNFDQGNVGAATLNLGTGTITTGAGGLVVNGKTAANDTIVGNNNGDTFLVNGANSGTITGTGLPTVTFSTVGNLTGGTGTDTFTISGGSLTSVNGGTGVNTLNGDNTTNNWAINTANAGTLNTITFSNIQKLVGGNAVDNFTFTGTGAETSIDGGTGAGNNDKLDISGLAAATVNLTASGANGFNGTSSVGPAGFSNIDTIVGNGSGSLQNSAGAGTWTVGASDTLKISTNPALAFSGFTTLAGGSGDGLVASDAAANAWVINTAGGGSVTGGVAYTFTGMSALTAGSAGDSFTFNGTGSMGTITGGAGIDSIDTSGLAGAATVQLNSDTASGFTGTSTVGVTNFSNIDSFTSKAGGTLTSALGNSSAWAINLANAGSLTDNTSSQVFGFTNFSTLNADSHGDSFTFTGTGAVSTINGGAGADSIDTSGLAGAATVQLNSDTASGFTGTSTVGVANFTNIDSYKSKAGGTLTSNLGNSSAWAINVANAGSVTDNTSSKVFGFTNFGTLNADAHGDSFTFTGSGSVSTINGGAGADSIDTSGLAGAATVQLNSDTASGFTGTSTVGVANFTNIDSFTSKSGGTLTSALGNSSAWAINLANAGSLTDNTSSKVFGFGGMSTLNADAFGDSFTFTGTGSVATINGGAGADSIDTSGLAGAATVQLNSDGSNGFTGTSTVGVTNFTNIDSFTSKSGGTLTSALGNSTAWAINLANAGSVTDNTSSQVFGFGGMSILNADAFGDSFTFTGTGSVSTINGGAGADSIDTSGLAGAATVQLNSDTASGFTGTSTVGVGIFTNIDSFTSKSGGTLTSALGNSTAWAISTANTGNVTDNTSSQVFGFANFSTLNADANGDSFTFTGTGSVSTIHGGAGADSIDTSGLAGAATVQLNSDTASGFTGTSTVGVANFTNIDSFTSKAGGTLTSALGNSSAWSITTANTGSVKDNTSGHTFGFTNFSTLNADAFGDSFKFTGTGSVSTIHGGAGADSIDTSGLAGAASVVLNSDGASGFTGTSTVGVANFTNIDSYTSKAGGSLQNSLGSAATWTVGATDTLLNSGHTLTFAGFGTLTGAGTDTLNASDAVANTWSISNPDAGSVSGGVAYTFTGMSILGAGTGGDTFSIGATGSVATINGNTGTDTIDLTALSAATIALNSSTASGFTGTSSVGVTTGFNGIDVIQSAAGGTLTTDGNNNQVTLASSSGNGFDGSLSDGTASLTFDNFSTLHGGAGTNTLIGSNTTNQWTITNPDKGTFSDGTHTLNWDGIGSLTGGTVGDTFTFHDTATLSGAVNGGGGTDILDLSAYTTEVDAALGLAGTHGFNGTTSGVGGNTPVANFTNIDEIDAPNGTGGLDNVLTGANGTASWTLSTATYSEGGKNLIFSNFGTLTGNAGSDTFNIDLSTSLTLNGGAGNDHFILSTGAVDTGVIDGGTGDNSLQGDDNGDTFLISGNDSGSVGRKGVSNNNLIASFTNIDQLIGGADDDDFAFGASGSLTGTAPSIDGGGTSTSAGNSIDFSLSTIHQVTLGAAIVGVPALTSIQSLVGNGTNFTILGDNTGDTFELVVGQPYQGTVIYNNCPLCTPITLKFIGATSLAGGTGNDDFIIDDTATLSGSIKGGGGSDTLDLSGYTTAVDVTLNGSDANGLAGVDAQGILGSGFSEISTLKGSSALGTLTGEDGVHNQWIINAADGGTVNDQTAILAFSGFNKLVGGSGQDDFAISGGSVISVDGAGGSNSLTGDNTTNVWHVTGANQGTLNATLAFKNVGSLIGNAQNDTFNFDNAATLSGNLDGGTGGVNVLNLGSYLTAVDVALSGEGTNVGFAGTTSGGIHPNPIGGTFDDVTEIDDGTGGGSLTGYNVVAGAGVATWTIGANPTYNDGSRSLKFSGFDALVGNANFDAFVLVTGTSWAGSIDGAGGDNSLQGDDNGDYFLVNSPNAGNVATDNTDTVLLIGSFKNINQLLGGAGNDDFAFVGTGALTSGDNKAKIDGGGFVAATNGNVLDYSGFVGAVSLNLGTGTNGISNIQTLDGNGTSFTLQADTTGDTFTINGADAGSVAYGLGTLNFINVGNLEGNTGADFFDFTTGTASVHSIIGQGGNDTIDYTGYGSAVTFDLNAGVGTTTGITGTWSGVTAVTGTAGSTIIGSGQTYNLTGSNVGNNGTVSWTNFANLHDSGAGIFNMHSSGTDGSVTGSIQAVGGTLNYAGYSMAITFDLGDGSGKTTGIGTTWSGITTVTGSINSDTITGNGNTYNLTGLDAGNDGPISWTSIEILSDSAGGNFNVDTGGSVTSISAVNGSVSYSTYGSGITFDLGGGASTGIGSWTGITGLTGSNHNDTVTGSAQTYELTALNDGTNGTVTWTSIENLTDSGAGVFDMHFGTNGSISGNISAVNGSISYVGYTTAANFNLGGGASTGMAGWTGIISVTGSSNSDTISGANQTYNLTSANDGNNGTVFWTTFENVADSGTGTINTTGGQTYTLSGADQGSVGVLAGGFSGIGHLADTGAATFNMGTNGSVASVSAVAGAVNYGSYGVGITFNLGGGASTGITSSWTGITTLTGSGHSDTVTGSGQTYNLTALNDGNNGTVFWTAIENLSDSGAGVFNMHPTTTDGSISGSISAVGGTLNYAGYSSAITFDLANGAGNTTGLGVGWSGITTLTGSGNSDFVFGSGTTYNLTGANAGNNGTVFWTSIENLDDVGAGDFKMGASGSVAGSITAVGGTVDYTGRAGAVTFDLSDVSAATTGIGTTWAGITHVTGSATPANDTITGSGQTYNLTAANAGNNGTVFWTSFGNLSDSGAGDFKMGASGSVAGSISAVGGTVDYTGRAGALSFDLSDASGASTGIGTTWAGITHVTGSATPTNDTLLGSGQTYNLTALNAGNNGTVFWTNFGNLNDSGAGDFKMGASGSVAGNISAVAGTVDYTGRAGAVTFNLEGTANKSTGITGTWAGITTMVGSATPANDTVTGTNDTYNLTGLDAGNNGTVFWTNVANLNDSAAGDFKMHSVTDGSLATVTAVGGTVDYTGYSPPISFSTTGGPSTGITVSWTGITHFVGTGNPGDTLTGNGGTYNLTGLDAGNNGTIFWTNIATLTDTGAATFNFFATGSLTSIAAVGGTVSFASYGSAFSFDLGGGAGTGITGSWSGITHLTGNANSNTVTGSGQTYNLTALNAGNNGTVFWTSVQNLSDSGAGVFNMHPTTTDGSVSGSISAVGGKVDYTGYSTAINFDLGGGASTGMAGWTGITTLTGSGHSDTVTGSGQTYNLTAPNAGNNGTVFWTSIENLTDSGAGDFKFATGSSVSGNIIATAGTVDYTGNTGVITFNLGGTANNTTGIGGTWSGITTLIGSGTPANDTVTGTNDTYNLTAGNAGNDGTVFWTNVANLDDSAAGDFKFGTGSSVAGSIKAVGGTLDYSAYGSGITFDLSDGSGNTTGIGTTWTGITHVIGTGSGDTVTGSGQTYNLTGANAGNNGTVFWTAIENLTDSGAGVFNMHSGGSDGSVTGNISAVGGTVNYAGYTTAISFDLGGGASTGMAGWTGITHLTGSGNSDTVTGSGQTYNLTGANAGNNGTVFWTSIENLTDSGAGDFKMGASGSVAGNIVASGGTIDYTGRVGAVTFDLEATANKTTGITGTWTGITSLVGSATPTNDTVTGNGDTYTLDNTTANKGSNGTVSWTNVGNLTDAGAGTFNMGTGGSVSGNIKAVGGSVSYLNYGSAVNFNLSGAASTGMAGWTGITSVTGSGNSDTISGSSQTYNLTGLNAGNNGTVFWTSFENVADSGTGTIKTSGATYVFTTGSNHGTVSVLGGGFSGVGNFVDTGAASFTFDAGTSITGSLAANQGSIDYSAVTTGANVTVTGATANGYSGTMSAIVAGGFTGITSITADTNTANKITGDSNGGTWTVNATNGGSYDDGTATSPSPLSFSNFSTLASAATSTNTYNLTGGGLASILGTGSDTVNVNATFGNTGTALSITAGSILNGGGQLDASTLTLNGTTLGTGTGNRLNIDVTTLVISNAAATAFINSVGSVAFGNSSLTNLNLVAAGNITGGRLVASGNVSLTANGGAIGAGTGSPFTTNINGTLSAVTTGGDIDVSNSTNGVTLGTINSAGAISIVSTAGITLNGGTSLTAAGGGVTLSGLSGSNVNVGGSFGVTTGSGGLTINAAGLFNLGGNTLTLNGNNLQVNGTTASANGTIQGAGITLNGTATGSGLTLSSGSSGISLAGVNLSGTLSVTTSAAGSLALNNNVNVGTLAASGLAGNLVISGSNVTLTDGSSLDLSHAKGIIGRTNGGQSLTIDDGSNTVTLPTVGGNNRRLKSLTVDAKTINTGAVNTSGSQSYTGAVNLNNTWDNNGSGNISVTGAITLTGSGTINNSGGGINLTGTVDGHQQLTLTAKGNVLISGAVGAKNTLIGLTATGSNITLNSTVTTNQGQHYTGNVNLNDDLNSVLGGLIFSGGTVHVLQSLALQADTIDFSGTHTVTTTKGATLALIPETKDLNVVIGGSGAGQLNLSNTALSGYEGTLIIGALPKDASNADGGILPAQAGNVTVSGPLALGSSGTLVLVSPHNLTINADIQAPNIILGATTAVLDPNGAQVIGTNLDVIGGSIGAQGADITGSALGGAASLSWGTSGQSAQFDMKSVQVATVPGGATVTEYASDLGVSLNQNAHSQNSGQQAAANQQTGGLLGSGFIDVSVFQQISLYDVNGSGIQLPSDQCEEESTSGTGCGQ